MGRSRYKIVDTSYPYFLTLTVNHWIPIFTRPMTVDIILDALAYRQKHHDLKIYAYVILENHLHLIAQSAQLDKEIANFKSWTARQIIDKLKEQRLTKVLEPFAFYKKSHKTDRKYQFWEEGFHPQQISNIDIMRQKVDYIHYNPVKRGYIEEIQHWRYSSAKNYLGMEGLIEVTRIW